MKKLGKLSINVDKIMKNEELVNLRGGYEWGYGSCAATITMEGVEFCDIGLSRSSAIAWARCADTVNGTNCEGNWCCDNCSSASWLPCSN